MRLYKAIFLKPPKGFIKTHINLFYAVILRSGLWFEKRCLSTEPCIWQEDVCVYAPFHRTPGEFGAKLRGGRTFLKCKKTRKVFRTCRRSERAPAYGAQRNHANTEDDLFAVDRAIPWRLAPSKCVPDPRHFFFPFHKTARYTG